MKHIVEILKTSKSPLLNTICNSLNDPKIPQIITRINKIIDESIQQDDNREDLCFGVKSGINGTLDICRKVYIEILEDINKTIDKYQNTCIYIYKNTINSILLFIYCLL